MVPTGTVRWLELNGQPRSIRVLDRKATVEHVTRVRADAEDPLQIGPMLGSVVAVRVQKGGRVEAGDLLLVLSAMKMETIVTAPAGAASPRSA